MLYYVVKCCQINNYFATMRIIHFTNNYLPRVSGVARAVYNYKIGLEKLGHKVLIIAPKYTRKTNTNIKKGIVRVDSIRLSGLFESLNYPLPIYFFKKIETICLEFKPDIIHSHHPFFLGKIALKFAHKYRKSLIYTYHTPYFEYFKTKRLSTFSLFLQNGVKSLIRNYIKHCDTVIVPSPIMKQNISIKNRSQIKVLPSPIDLNVFLYPRKDFIRRKYQLKPSDLILLTVSRLSYEKNLFFLLEAFANVLKRLSKNVYLVIVGGGYLKSLLVIKAKKLKIDRWVIFTGQVNYTSLPHYYSGADVFVYAGSFESQGLTITEAIVSGLPLVVLDKFGSAQHFVKNNETGFLTSNKNNFISYIIKMLNNENLRRRISINQKKQQANYSIETISKKLEEIYNNLLNHNAR